MSGKTEQCRPKLCTGLFLEWHPFSLKVLISSNFQAFEESFQKLPQTTHRLVVQSSGSRTERPGTLVLWQNSQWLTPGGRRSQLGSNWRTYNDSGEQNNNTRPTIIRSKVVTTAGGPSIICCRVRLRHKQQRQQQRHHRGGHV